MNDTRTKIEVELDAALTEHHRLREIIRDEERRLRKLQEDAQPVEVLAQRLRMALFAIDGQSDKHYGDANSANHKRLMELLGGAS